MYKHYLFNKGKENVVFFYTYFNRYYRDKSDNVWYIRSLEIIQITKKM